MLASLTTRARSRALRFVAVAGLAFIGLTCRDKDLTGPGLPQRARLSVAPSFNTAAEMPTVRLSKVKAEVFRIPSGDLLLTDSAFFTPGDDAIELDLLVPMLRQDEQFRVRLSAWDESTPPALVFVGEKNVRATPGLVPAGVANIDLHYTGPDTVVRTVRVAPKPDTVLTLGDNFTFRGQALRADESVVPDAHIGWTSRDTTVVTIDRNTGVATARAEGANVWIVGTSFTDKRDSTRVTVTQAVATVAVSPASPADVIRGRTVQFTATVKDAGGRDMPTRPVYWVSADTSIAKVSSTGQVLGVAIGTTTISVTSGSITTQVTVNVIQVPVFRVLIAPTDTTIYIDDAATLRARVEDDLGNELTGRLVLWASLNPGIATVDLNTGRVTGVSAGTATITATSETKVATTTVVVVPVGSVVITPASDTVPVGDSTKYVARVRAADESVLPNRRIVWQTLDSNIATVDSAGVVKGVTVGLTGVVASYGGRADTADVHVRPLLDEVRVEPDSAHFNALGDTVKLSARAFIGQTEVAGDFTWVSRDASVATVSSTGTVTAVGNGAVYVVAVEQASGMADSSLITVQQQVSSVTITPSTKTLYLGTTFKLSVTAVDGRGNAMPAATTFAWSSNSNGVATVDTGGTVTPHAPGSAVISATAGGVTGTAVITVQSAIQRIVVTPDTTTLASLGLTVAYSAVAYDTLDAVMTGITFTWASSNPSVAPLDSITATGARATAYTNGFTSIRASAQGVTGSAALTIQQQLAAVEVTPSAATVAPGGNLQLVARGKDANNRYMSPGVVTWSSNTPSVATVNSSTGVVTGVAVGTTQITASSGTITSNQATITVSNSVPPVISFGRDTIPIGRGSSTSIPVFLSTASATGSTVTVNLSTADTIAYFSTATVSFAPGQTAANVTLNGRNAGTTRIFATDAGGTYAGDTAVVTVQANVRIATTGISLNTGDSYSTQVLLSDPSPAGGTYIAFTYSVAGIGSVSPDPAFIPAGQLAADIIVRATSPGSTTIRPTAAGVNGTATTLNAAVPRLSFSHGTQRLGAGQYAPSHYIHLPNNSNNALVVTLTSSDTNVARTPATVTIPAGTYYVYFDVRGPQAGSATVIATASGWVPDTLYVTTTSPRLGITGGGTYTSTSPARPVSVYAEDSTSAAHYRINSLVVTLSSTDTNVVKLQDTTVTIAAGQYYTNSGRVIPKGAGSAWIRASAGGHAIDSTQFTIVGPKLSFSFTTARYGVGQQSSSSDHYVHVPHNVTSPLTITLSTADTNIVGVPSTVTIPAGSYYAYFTIRAKSHVSSQALYATAEGHQPDTATVRITSPRVTSCCSATINAFSSDRSLTIYAADSVGSHHYLTSPQRFTLTSSDTNVIRIDSAAVTIAAGQYYNNTARIVAVDTGTAKIYVTGPEGWINDSSSVYTVVTPKLGVSFHSNLIGLRQYIGPTDAYVHTPDNRRDTLRISITQKHPELVRLTGNADTVIVIPPGTYYRYFGYEAIGLGRDTIIFSAPGYKPDTAYVTVTTPKLTTGGISSTATTTTPPQSVIVYATDSVGTAHYTMDTLAIYATSSDSNVIRPESALFHMPKGAYYRYTKVLFVGPDTARLTFSDSAGLYTGVSTNLVTVTGPSLRMSTATSKLGMRQYSTDRYVHVDNTVTGSPLVVYLISTDTNVATVPDSVIIPVGSYYAYFRMEAQDTVGTIQIQATATGYSPVNTQLQVTEPKFVLSTSTTRNTTSPPTTLTVYATDADGNSHYVAEDVTVTLSSSAPSVAYPDSVTITIDSGTYYSNDARIRFLSEGSTRITASDSRAAIYRYNPGFVDITVNTPTVSLGSVPSSLGVGQYADPYVYLPDHTTDTVTVTLTHIGSANTSVPTTVKVPPGTYYAYFRMTGVSVGSDSIIVSAPGHHSDTVFTTVGTGTIQISGWPSGMTVGQTTGMTLYTDDQNGANHYVAAPTTFTLAPANDNIRFYTTSSAADDAFITSITVPANASYVSLYVRARAAGTSGVSISNADYTTYTNTTTVAP